MLDVYEIGCEVYDGETVWGFEYVTKEHDAARFDRTVAALMSRALKYARERGKKITSETNKVETCAQWSLVEFTFTEV